MNKSKANFWLILAAIWILGSFTYIIAKYVFNVTLNWVAFLSVGAMLYLAVELWNDDKRKEEERIRNLQEQIEELKKQLRTLRNEK